MQNLVYQKGFKIKTVISAFNRAQDSITKQISTSKYKKMFKDLYLENRKGKKEIIQYSWDRVNIIKRKK